MRASMAISIVLAGILSVWLVALLLHRNGRAVPWALLRLPGIPMVCFRRGAIHDCALFRCRSIELGELATVEYAYHAVVGFEAAWIFTAKDGRAITVAPYRPGLLRLLTELERHLAGFSIAQWKKAFAEGDVVDTLLLWEARGSSAAVATGMGR